jgi:hypothetical protein
MNNFIARKTAWKLYRQGYRSDSLVDFSRVCDACAEMDITDSQAIKKVYQELKDVHRMRKEQAYEQV